MQTYLALLPTGLTATVEADGRTLAAAVAALALELDELPAGSVLIRLAA